MAMPVMLSGRMMVGLHGYSSKAVRLGFPKKPNGGSEHGIILSVLDIGGACRCPSGDGAAGRYCRGEFGWWTFIPGGALRRPLS